MATITGGRANIALAKTAKTFVELGFTASNVDIIYEVHNTLRSWKPGRTINAVTQTTVGRGYWIVAKTDIELPNDFATEIEQVVTTGDGDIIVFNS